MPRLILEDRLELHVIRFCIAAGSVNGVSGLVFNKVDMSICILDKLVGQQSVMSNAQNTFISSME
jgi:hypothetical protein